MFNLARKINETDVEPGSLAIFWLAQAGFAYKTSTGKIIYVDPYLSNCVNRQLSHLLYGFKRMVPTLVEAEEVEADCVVCTHSHPDHFDYDAIPVIAQKPRAHFVAAPDCRAEFDKLGVTTGRYTILEEGEKLDYGDFGLIGIYADHGEQAPEALGVMIQVGDIKVWQVGDTAYRPDKWQDVFKMGVDVIIPPINGAFGNLDSLEAARLVRDAHARVAIPCHFWMFAEHGGNPAQFMDACKELAPETRPLLMSPGELFIFKKE